MTTDPDVLACLEESDAEATTERKAFRLIGWFSAGMALAALGIYLGTELRSRYKFKRRTPYDFYSNSAEAQASEFGMGV